MKINKIQNKRSVVLILSVILIAAISFGVYYFFFRQSDDEKRRTDSLTSIDANKSLEDKDKSIPADESASKENDKTIVPSDPGTSPEGASRLEKPTITRAMQSGANVRVSAIFTQPAYGQCVASFKQTNQEPIIKTVPVVVGPSYYTCNGFLVPVSEFPAKGEWVVTITHEHDSKTITSDAKAIKIE